MTEPRPVIKSLRRRKELHKQRSKLYRVPFAVVGGLIMVVGAALALPGVPGPGLLLVAVGLGMLALEFDRWCRAPAREDPRPGRGRARAHEHVAAGRARRRRARAQRRLLRGGLRDRYPGATGLRAAAADGLAEWRRSSWTPHRAQLGGTTSAATRRLRISVSTTISSTRTVVLFIGVLSAVQARALKRTTTRWVIRVGWSEQ